MEQIKYDTTYRRLFAKIIDYTLIILILQILEFIFIPTSSYTVNLDFKNGTDPFTENPNIIRDFWNMYGELIRALIIIFYFIIFHFIFGQSLGKMITNVKVYNINETDKLKIAQAILRNIPDIIYVLIVFFIPWEYLPIIIVIFWNIFNLFQVFSSKKHQTINDLIAKTVVLKIPQQKIIIDSKTE